MPTEADFLRAIDAQPDDETLRLVYADWLDENGDPRAAEVRERCAVIARIVGKLHRLREADINDELPYPDPHSYRLNATYSPAEVVAYEVKHGIRLPDDYRDFLLRIGGGGTGPGLGFVGLPHLASAYRPTEPFTPIEADDLWHPLDGTVPLSTSDVPQNRPTVVVVTGEHRDEVWHEDEMGFFRHAAPSFFVWYERWLDATLAEHEVARAPAAFAALAESGRDGLREVLARTDDPNRRVAEIAWRTIWGQGDRAAVLVPELVALIRRYLAPGADVPPLTAACTPAETADAAGLALGQLGRAADAAIPLLVPLLTKTNPSLRVVVIYSLLAVGGGRYAVPAILDQIADSVDNRGRCRWIMALGLLKEHARPAAAALRELSDADPPSANRARASFLVYNVGRFARKALADIECASPQCPAFQIDRLEPEIYIGGFEEK